jgi:Flp pilus assembly protein CpaB
MAQQPVTARVRQRQRRRRIAIALGLLLLVGGVGGYLYSTSKPEGPPPPRREPGWVEVPTSATEVAVGNVLQRQLLRPNYVPPQAVPPNAILGMQRVQGRVAMRRIPPGTYFTEDDLAPLGAPAGLSALAKDGTRVIVIDVKRVEGAVGFLNPGDRIDVISITTIGNAAGGRPTGLAASPNTLQGGGTQPGDPNSPARTAVRGSTTAAPAGASATLIAEDVEVVRSPRTDIPDRAPHPLVLRMKPQDAHVTVLAMASGQTLRFVHRPFGERDRITQPPPPAEFTHSKVDVRQVQVINGVAHSTERAILD